MPCIDPSRSTGDERRVLALIAALATIAAIGGCSSDGARPPAGTGESQPTGEATTAVPTPPSTTIAMAPHSPAVVLPAPGPVRTWDQLRMQAARRIVAASPNGSYTSPAPDVLLAIPVLEIELNADGSVRRIGVLRHPRQATDTTQLAIDAVRRAAPFGDVSKLSKPWKFSETFLFNDDRQFKPRSLD